MRDDRRYMKKDKPQKNYKAFANFLFEAGVLARTPRSGFRHLGSWRQSVAEHLLRTTYVGFTLAHLERGKDDSIDIEKVLECCLFHDFGEARALDLDYISQKYSNSDELKAIKDAVKDLPFGQRVIEAFSETEKQSTKEGIIAKDADHLELLLTLKEIMDNGNQQAADWIGPAMKRFKTDSAKLLADEILNTGSDEWWFADKSDNYWVTGGKDNK